MYAGFEAFGVERIGRFVFCDCDWLLLENGTPIHDFADLVPRDRMATFVVNQCPGRGMPARVAGQRSVVEVGRASPRQGQDLLWNKTHIGNTEQIIEWRRFEGGQQICRWVQERDTQLV